MVMKLYGVPLSPFVAIAAISLDLLGAEYEAIPMRPHTEDAEFLKASPLGKIPALGDGDYAVADSTAIVVYADSKLKKCCGEGSLLGSDAQTRGQIAFFEKYIQGDGCAISSRLFAQMFKDPKDTEAMAAANEEAIKVLKFLNEHVQDNGHFVGSSYTLADIAVFAHLAAYQLLNPLDSAAYPKLANFFAKAEVIPEFAKAHNACKQMAAQVFGNKSDAKN